MIIGNLVMGVFFIVLGLVIQSGKANILIAGYNTMTEEQRAEWNSKAMYKFIGWFLLVIPSIILLLACIPMALDFYPTHFIYISWGIWFAIILIGVIYLNKSKRFKKSQSL